MSYPFGSVGPEGRTEFLSENLSQEPRPRARVLRATVVALLVMGLFAGGLWLAYIQGMRHGVSGGGGGEVPLIRADERPTKVRPDKPGGMEIPDRDKLIYTQKRAAVEHLLPAPEKPMPRPTPPSTPAQPGQSLPPATAETAVAPSSAAPSDATATAPSVGTAGATAEAASAATLPQQQSVAAAPTKPVAASPQPAKTGGVRLQLGSLRSEEAARREWDRLKRANTDLLGSLSATTERADLGDRGIFYRIQTSP